MNRRVQQGQLQQGVAFAGIAPILDPIFRRTFGDWHVSGRQRPTAYSMNALGDESQESGSWR